MPGSVGYVKFKTFTFKKNLTTPLYGWDQLLLFNTWSVGLPGAYLVDLRGKNGQVDLGATQLFFN